MVDEQVFDPDGESLVERYRRCESDDVASAFVDLGGAVRVLEAQRLAMLAVLDERQAWKADGARDAAGWVAQADAVRLATARAMADVARALANLPAVAAVAAEGRLSFDQLRPLATLATPGSDNRWAADAPGMDPAHLDAAARRARRVAREAAEEQRGRRCLRAWQARGGGLRGTFFLPDADGAAVLAELDRRAQAMTPAEGEPWDPLDIRRADALVDLCTTTPAGETTPATVVVHAQAGALGPSANGWVCLPDGTPLALETLRRLGCDARTQLALHDDAGRLVGLTSLRRTVPHRIRRLLTARDRTCRFPGCESATGLHAHHLRFWSDGGPTELPNLALLCTRHHALVHDHGWTLTGDPDHPAGLTFARPDGRTVGTALDPLSDELRDRVLSDLPTPPPPPASPTHPDRAHRLRVLAACRARIRAELLAEDDAAGS